MRHCAPQVRGVTATLPVQVAVHAGRQLDASWTRRGFPFHSPPGQRGRNLAATAAPPAACQPPAAASQPASLAAARASRSGTVETRGTAASTELGRRLLHIVGQPSRRSVPATCPARPHPPPLPPTLRCRPPSAAPPAQPLLALVCMRLCVVPPWGCWGALQGAAVLSPCRRSGPLRRPTLPLLPPPPPSSCCPWASAWAGAASAPQCACAAEAPLGRPCPAPPRQPPALPPP